MRMYTLSAPLHLCVSKKEPDNSLAPEHCSFKFFCCKRRDTNCSGSGAEARILKI